jgi:hypothetical protein
MSLIYHNLDTPNRRMMVLLDRNRSATMMDLAFITMIVGFFAVSVGLVRFCASLLPRGGRP